MQKLKPLRTLFITLTLTVVFSTSLVAQHTNDSTALVQFGNKGLELSTRNKSHLLQIDLRGQFRLAYPTDSDPITLNDFQTNQVIINVNRARIKLGGYSFKPWLKYYTEYELMAGNLLDFRIMLTKLPYLNLKVGQWKAQYNRERIISSGKQQTVERSILTRPFTIDRQQGISIYGNIAGVGIANFNYWVSTFMGTGRGAKTNDDEHLMWMTRLQWNFMGKEIKFSGSDLSFNKSLVALLAISGVTNQSSFTRFSSAGGGSLEGFENGQAGQYRVNQLMLETAGMIRGFSWQQEYHWKQIYDTQNPAYTVLSGNLIQLGYFPSQLFRPIPKYLELYGRYAFYYPDMSDLNNIRQEFSIGINWFIRKHRNKFTLEVSHIQNTQALNVQIEGFRYRLQWEISL